MVQTDSIWDDVENSSCKQCGGTIKEEFEQIVDEPRDQELWDAGEITRQGKWIQTLLCKECGKIYGKRACDITKTYKYHNDEIPDTVETSRSEWRYLDV